MENFQDNLNDIGGLYFSSVIDLKMVYYEIKLDEFSQKLSTIVLPLGK